MRVEEKSMEKLDLLIKQFYMELGPDFISTDIVGLEDGLSIAGASIDSSFNSVDTSTHFSRAMKSAALAFGKMGLGKLEENLTTTDKTYIIARFIGDGSYYWGVAASKELPLPLLREIINRYAVKIKDVIF
jgi:predicted regulator of Ras-like GTPase activity (Roadblock/LC7/MglB family)